MLFRSGQAKLEAAKQEYAAGEARLAAVQPIYDTVKPLYDRYIQTQAEYQAARDAGDNTRALGLWASVEAQRIAYETQLGGYSMSELISEYEAGQAQLASGAAQLSEGEAQLRKAEQDLADGQAKLDEAAAQINAGQAKLDAGKAELDAGKAALAGARNELDAGREKIRENKEALSADLASFGEYENDLERLDAGVRRLTEISGVSDRVPKNATYGEVLSAAKNYFADADADAQSENRLHSFRCIALLIAGALGLNAGIFGMFWRRGGRVLSMLAVPFALAAALLGGAVRSFEQGGLSLARLIAALAVLLFAIAAFSVLRLGQQRRPVPIGARAAEQVEETKEAEAEGEPEA